MHRKESKQLIVYNKPTSHKSLQLQPRVSIQVHSNAHNHKENPTSLPHDPSLLGIVGTKGHVRLNKPGSSTQLLRVVPCDHRRSIFSPLRSLWATIKSKEWTLPRRSHDTASRIRRAVGARTLVCVST